MFKVFDEPNPDDFINPIDQQTLMALMMGQMLSQTKTQEPASGKRGTPQKSNVNSDILDQMVQPQGNEAYMAGGA